MPTNEMKSALKVDMPSRTTTASSLTLIESPRQMTPFTGVLPPSSNRLPWSPYLVRALYEYHPVEAHDLSFLRGDLIEIISLEDSKWWKGKLRDRIGMIPSNFVEVIDLLGRSRDPRPAQPGARTSGEQSRPIVNSPSGNTKKELRLLIPNQEADVTLKETNSPKRSPIMQLAPPSALSPSSATYPITAQWVRARHKWSSGKKRELELQKGDVIQVIGRPHEHWWKGVLARNGITGLFPANYVEAIPNATDLPSEPNAVGGRTNAYLTLTSGIPPTLPAARKGKASAIKDRASASAAAPPIPDTRHWGNPRRNMTVSSGKSMVLPQVPGSPDPTSSKQPSGDTRRPAKATASNRVSVAGSLGSRYEGRLSVIERDIAKAREQYPSDVPRKEVKTRGLPTALAIFKPGKQRHQRSTVDGSNEQKTIWNPDKQYLIRHVVHGNHSPKHRNTPGGSRLQ
jgi:hypothetical protein